MEDLIQISNVTKQYDGGVQALRAVSTSIRRGEIFALLGPNGAGKTTLISIICGLVVPSSGAVKVDGMDMQRDYREVRKLIGLVPQEIHLEGFVSVYDTVRFSRGLHNKPDDPKYIDDLLKRLSLWDKRNSRLQRLSGGMSRRVLIAKALAHNPRILFLDEPSAGVDVELRKDMWSLIDELRASGVTIILTTHYIEEAEKMADRVGVIAGGELILVEDKASLMARMGHKQLFISLAEEMAQIPDALAEYRLELMEGGCTLVYCYDGAAQRKGITDLMRSLASLGIGYRDLRTEQSSLEDIFVNLVGMSGGAQGRKANNGRQQ